MRVVAYEPAPVPTTVLFACTFIASLQYCARTDEVAASRSGVLPGVRACGSVSWFQASVVWPPMPPGEAASASSTATGTSASPAEQAAAGEPARARVGRALRS